MQWAFAGPPPKVRVVASPEHSTTIARTAAASAVIARVVMAGLVSSGGGDRGWAAGMAKAARTAGVRRVRAVFGR
ncbi:hypothetical protein Aau02nite_63360 [Amorphoplanes auranticolor]|uniref:Uncharacterized protein n=1 Tax=Actinoplanes auranticolor TaxID=47988 RepID=A0A919SNY2_9ACTN|nr:hypothetical protein Aau02nite_63360 [Actinoplanes auranticolor]